MIPAMVEIAEDVLELAPDALFFNYGNPMAPVCRAIRKATGAPVVGLCHGVSHTAGYLAEVLSVPPIRFGYTAVGMNHLTWFTEARVDGTDAMPRLRELAEERVARFPEGSLGHRFVESGTVDGPSADVACPFSWSLFLLFGAFPAVLDRHVVEFFPQFFRDGKFYGKRLGIDSYSFEEVISSGDRAYEEMQRDALSSDALPGDYFVRKGGEHEQVVSIIDDMREDSGSTYSVNLPNRGQVPNLPFDAVVESPAIATAAGLRAISQPPLPAGVAGTLATRMMWVETIVEAAIEGDRDKFVQALVLDGCAQSLDIGSAMADELLTAHAQYLPQFG
jgi:alpha-galactosidase